MRKLPSTKVMEIFSEAAAAPDAARRLAYLDGACEGDAELRAEVESLLDAQREVGAFLDCPTVEGPQPADDAAPPEADARCIGGAREIGGRYVILERIGEGGFGVVYRARQEFPIRRDVALKIVKLGMDTRQIIARFETERQALALMDHPNIARIFDAAATTDGRPYFVMELVDGSPITDYCDSNRLTIDQRLAMFISVCQAVQHAHQKGIIHRDIKPSNILVAMIDGVPVPKVIDFGIAKAIQPRPGEQTAQTQVQHLVGTPQYMSPEQAGAENGDIDTRSDIYSLGVLLYELLTGTTPFDPQELGRRSYQQVHQLIREQDPPRPSARLTTMGAALEDVAQRRGMEGSKLCRTVAHELDWVVMKAIEKDRRQRYETASALADDVRRYLSHEPLLAGPPDTIYRLRKYARRHRRSLLAAAAVTLALLLGLAGTTFGLIRAKRDRNRAEAALDQAEQVSTFLSDMLRSANPDRAQGRQVLVRDVFDRTSRSLDQGALRNQPLVEAGIRMTLGGAYDSLGMYRESESHFKKAMAIREQLLGDQNRQTAQSMVAEAAAVANLGDVHTAEALTRRALDIQTKLLGEADPSVAFTFNRLGIILRGKPDPAGSEAALRKALELSRKYRLGTDMTVAVLTNLGVALMDRRDFDGAQPLLTEALALDRKEHGDKYRNVPRNLSNLAAIRQARGDLKGAQQDWREALRLQRDILQGDHPDVAWTLRLLGQCEQEDGQLAAGESHIREGLAMERRIFGPRHTMTLRFLDDLAEVLARQGRADEARATERQALDIRRSYEQATLAAHPDDAAHLAAMADLDLRGGEFQAALDNLNRAVARDPSNHWYWFLTACLRCYLGDDAGYRQACQQMLERFASTDRAEIAERTAKACLLSANPAGDLDRLTHLSDMALSKAKSYVAWFEMCRGLAEYRCGRYPQARQWFTKAATLDSTWGTPTVKLLLAMTDLRLGRTPEARSAYRAVIAQAGRDLPRAGHDDLGVSPENFLVFQIIRREADQMFHDPFDR